MCTQLAKNPAPDQIGTSRQKLGAQKCTCKSIPEGVREGYAFGCSIGERVTLSVARATSGDRDHPTLTPKLVSTPAQPCATPARCYHGGGGHVISVAWLHNTIGLSLPGDSGGLNMETCFKSSDVHLHGYSSAFPHTRTRRGCSSCTVVRVRYRLPPPFLPVLQYFRPLMQCC